MDPLRNRSLQLPSSSPTPSLICVGGMLRVAETPASNAVVSESLASHSSVQPPNLLHHNGNTPCRTPTVTPFKALASPFTVTTPFTAPSTPYSHSTVTPIPLRLSPTQTPTSLQGNSSVASKPPVNPTNFNRVKTFQKESQTPVNHLLTPKQVRELRRLCRKTANRAEFEDRLIQIRQVASIAAMASSSLHLFDPENPRSGLALRVWVETHRAEGADWRDERPLSDSAVDELRRWDRLLKGWARVRFETSNPGESDVPPHTYAGSGSNIVETVLHPIRLQFEQLSVGTSPITPLVRVKHAETGETRAVEHHSIAQLTSPTTPDEQGASFWRSPHVDVGGVGGGMRNSQSLGDVHGTISGRNAMHVVQSAWSKVSPSVMRDCVGERKPLEEVSINKVGDLINVTVPAMTRQQSSAPLRSLAKSSSCGMNASVVYGEENLLDIGQMKSWRNVVLDSTKYGSRVDDISIGAKHLHSYGENVDNAYGDGCANIHNLTPSTRADLDWGRLRGGEGSESSFSSLNGNKL